MGCGQENYKEDREDPDGSVANDSSELVTLFDCCCATTPRIIAPTPSQHSLRMWSQNKCIFLVLKNTVFPPYRNVYISMAHEQEVDSNDTVKTYDPNLDYGWLTNQPYALTNNDDVGPYDRGT